MFSLWPKTTLLYVFCIFILHTASAFLPSIGKIPSIHSKICLNINSQRISHAMEKKTLKMGLVDIVDFSDEEDEEIVTTKSNKDDTRTDQEKGLTHGYEGSFKVGDKVRVIVSTKIWSVKEYNKIGFDPQGMCGTVDALVLYGRKLKTLCSAITPVKVSFKPDNEGIPPNMFTRAWSAHFSAEELELVQ